MSYAVTGTALANCLGADSQSVLDRAFTGTAGFVAASEFYTFPFETALGVMPALDANGLDCVMTRIARVAFASVKQIKSAAHASVERWGARRVAYVFATSTGGLEETERTIAPHAMLPVESPYLYRNHGIDATTPAIMAYLGIAGIHLAISTACSSGLKALASATRLIDRGLADAVVVGSADSLCRTTVFGFHSLGLTSPAATRPFSKDRAGLTLGEGSAYLVLERDAEASRRAAVAWVGGTGAASDAFHHTTPHPEGLGGQLAMREALDRAGLSPNQISYVSAHGTGTPQNDATEAVAVNCVFERPIPLTATKSLTGHTLGSAGLTSVVLAIESLHRQVIPPTLRVTSDDALHVNVITTPTATAVDRVIVNAFGFGGSNASAVIARVP